VGVAEFLFQFLEHGLGEADLVRPALLRSSDGESTAWQAVNDLQGVDLGLVLREVIAEALDEAGVSTYFDPSEDPTYRAAVQERTGALQAVVGRSATRALVAKGTSLYAVDLGSRTVKTIADFTGRACHGWLGPGLTETLETPDILAEAGITWLGDFVVDDLPARVATAHGDLLSLPYSVELNDIPVVMIQHHDEEELPRRARLHAKRLIAEAEASAGVKIMCIAIHPYISGAPHRIRYLQEVYADIASRADVIHMNGAALLDWYKAGGQG
jgi:hypothetical protein